MAGNKKIKTRRGFLTTPLSEAHFFRDPPYQTFGPSLKERVIDLSNIIIIICQIFEIVILRGFGKRKRSSKKNGGRLVEISAVDQ